MAWVFSLSAECGEERGGAERFAQHFAGIEWVLSSGDRTHCNAGIFQDFDRNWWGQVCPSGVSQVGVDTPEAAFSMTEIGILLYQHLRSAPPFRYAIVGVEVDEFRTYTELTEPLEKPFVYPGLVLAEVVWQAVGSPPGFQHFSSGYVWQPYEGEVYKTSYKDEGYKPLMVSSDIKNKLSELLTT